MQHCDRSIVEVQVETIVFDFDNVIVRASENCKRSAWESVFVPMSHEYILVKEAQEIFANGKGDRFDILGHVLQLASDENPRADKRVIALANEYDQVVQKCIVQIGIAESDLEALLLLNRHFPLYIVSATPQESLHKTLFRLSEFYSVDICNLFSLVLGTPRTKPENLEIVHGHSRLPEHLMLMVGDGLNDYSAAETTGCGFVGVRTNDNQQYWVDTTFSKITAIDELPALLRVSL